MPSDTLLAQIDLDNLDGDSATKIGLECFLMDVKFNEKIKADK